MKTFNVISKRTTQGGKILEIKPDQSDLGLYSFCFVRDMNSGEVALVREYEDGFVYLKNKKIDPVHFDMNGDLSNGSFSNGVKVGIMEDASY